MAQNRKTKIYSIDDSLTIRAMLETLIGRDVDFDICGMAANAESAIEDIERRRPDIVLLDLALPGMDGLAFLDVARRQWEDVKVIVVSSSATQDSAICREALRLGAVACFDKSKIISKKRSFIALLDDVRAGDMSLSPAFGGAVTLPISHVADARENGAL